MHTASIPYTEHKSECTQLHYSQVCMYTASLFFLKVTFLLLYSLMPLPMIGLKALGHDVRPDFYAGIFACFHAISLERSRFSKIATFFSCPFSTEAIGIAHKPPRSL